MASTKGQKGRAATRTTRKPPAAPATATVEAGAPRKIRRTIRMAIRLPVTLDLVVESEDEVGDGVVSIDDTMFHVIRVRELPSDGGYTPRMIHEAMDDDEREELDRLARRAPPSRDI